MISRFSIKKQTSFVRTFINEMIKIICHNMFHYKTTADQSPELIHFSLTSICLWFIWAIYKAKEKKAQSFVTLPFTLIWCLLSMVQQGSILTSKILYQYVAKIDTNPCSKPSTQLNCYPRKRKKEMTQCMRLLPVCSLVFLGKVKLDLFPTIFGFSRWLMRSYNSNIRLQSCNIFWMWIQLHYLITPNDWLQYIGTNWH